MAKNNLQVVLFFTFLLSGIPQLFGIQNYPQISFNLDDAPVGETITEFRNLTENKYYLNVSNINRNVSFIIVQVHTFDENVTLSYTNPIDVHSFVTGTNIGLVWNDKVSNKFYTDSRMAELWLFRYGKFIRDLEVLISLTTYSKNDPVPGGCNLSFETEIAPYQKLNESSAVITVVSQPPSIYGEFCNQSSIVTEMYYLYLTEYSNSSKEYFDSILKMTTFQNVTKYGTKVPSGLSFTKFKQMYNTYRGTGRVFAAVSTYQGRSSAYIPAVSYGCNVNNWEEDCVGPAGTNWKIVTAFLFFCGLLICFSGHRFFKTMLFIIGYTFGVMILLLVVTIDNDFSDNGRTIYALVMGLFVGIAWVFLWWKFGVPVVAVQLTFILSGLLITSILFFTQLGDIYIFANELTFWIFFCSILVLNQMPVLCLKPLYHMIALSFLGSYAFIVALSYYVGGNLPYILINTYRRLSVKNFGRAVIDPPYQLLDISLTLLWILIFGLGIYNQYKHSIRRPPFPPHRSGSEITYANERTALLREEQPTLFDG